MIFPLKIILAFICSYLLGAIPTAYIFGRVFKGVDIRKHGSGNVGATNAFRVLGKIPGSIVLGIDILKGFLAAYLVPHLIGLEAIIYLVLCSLIAVIGHNWTIFLSFKGGKGIATSFGVLIGLTVQVPEIRPVLGLVILVWVVVFLGFRYVSLASILAAMVLPILLVFYGLPLEITALGIIFCVFVVFRHKPNIQRLLSGKESRISLFSAPKD